jgi:RNA polymerase sigma factor (sigma-70 family)
MQRYSQLVNTTCQRVLGQSDRVGDAIQATFLALARRAPYLDPRNGLGGWLRRVACRMAIRCRSRDRRQREVELLAARNRTSSQEFDSVEARDTEAVVREELDRLPDMYRLPLILCYLSGFTHAEVATQIGIPRGSVAKRLNEGLILLREILTVRGVQL